MHCLVGVEALAFCKDNAYSRNNGADNEPFRFFDF
jgi:hypothetical protein